MTEHTGCVVVGGGPAGMVAGLLLARAGVEVTVLEKHPDFLRDFRGDTVHPSTLTLLDELGLGARFNALPHSELNFAGFPTPDGGMMKLADLSRLHVAHPYIPMVPQWAFLNLRVAGIEAFRENVVSVCPEFADRVHELASMDDVKFLDVRLNLLRTWHRDGLLCIGDAAHAMSPVGGVGINLAVQDAVGAVTL